MHAVRMLSDREGSPNHTHVYWYRAGEVYSRESEPPISAELMEAFVAQGRAIEVDAQGNPVGIPADKRATKAADASALVALQASTAATEEPTADMGDEDVQPGRSGLARRR